MRVELSYNDWLNLIQDIGLEAAQKRMSFNEYQSFKLLNVFLDLQGFRHSWNNSDIKIKNETFVKIKNLL